MWAPSNVDWLRILTSNAHDQAKGGPAIMDATELKDVMGRYRDLVYRIAYTYLRNPADADDVTQDVFVQVMRCDVAFESDEHSTSAAGWRASPSTAANRSFACLGAGSKTSTTMRGRYLYLTSKRSAKCSPRCWRYRKSTACLWSCITTEDSRPTRSPRYSRFPRQLPEPAFHAGAPS